MVALERLRNFGFDMETFTTAETDLGNVLKGWTKRPLQQLRDQSRVSTVAMCREGSGQVTSHAQWRPCVNAGQDLHSVAGTSPWRAPSNTNDQGSIFSGFVQPLSLLEDAGYARQSDQNPGSTPRHLQSVDGVGAANTCNWNGNVVDPVNFESGDFGLLSWNRTFQYLGTDQAISHSL